MNDSYQLSIIDIESYFMMPSNVSERGGVAGERKGVSSDIGGGRRQHRY
jgi:hypothetical protein